MPEWTEDAVPTSCPRAGRFRRRRRVVGLVVIALLVGCYWTPLWWLSVSAFLYALLAGILIAFAWFMVVFLGL